MNKDIIILGEIHGAKKNIEVIKYLIKKFGIKTICFEWSDEWFEKEGKPIFDKIPKDGRFSIEHFKFLSKIKNKILIKYLLDENLSDWNESDKKSAQILEEVLKLDINKPVLVVLGKLHARKKKFYLKSYSNNVLIPTGAYFAGKACFVEIGYLGGEIFNFEKKKLALDKKIQDFFNKGGGEFSLIKSNNNYFDYKIIVKETEALLG